MNNSRGFYPWPPAPTRWDTARQVLLFVTEFLALVAAVAGICVAFLMAWA